MFEGKNFIQIFAMGGAAMYILLLCSMISIGVMIERILHYRACASVNLQAFMKMIRAEVGKGSIETASALCDKNPAPLTAVVRAGLRKDGKDEKEVTGAMEREIMVQTVLLEKYTTIVGTIGNIAVYIGLFGTVIGIIRSFHNISLVGSGGITVVIGGVSEALIATATGLSVAIPAVVGYNYFVRRVDNFVTGMEYAASETADLLASRRKA